MARKRGAAGGLALAALAVGLASWRRASRRSRDSDLAGQVALITGSSRGMGFLLAREFAREGCRVVICARNEAPLEEARRRLEADGAQVLAVQCDVSDRSQVDRLVAEATNRFGRIDILVNNAGIVQVGPLQTMTTEDFEMAMGIMYWGTLHPILAVLPQMLHRRSGRIVNVTSIGGKVSVPHLLPYNSAKFAAVGLSEGLGAELARDGISVTTIVPGLMRTGSHTNAYFKGKREGEYTWFSLGASLPLISMDAERAARQMVGAARRRDAVRVLSLPATLLDRFHGLFPGVTVRVLGLVNYLLPRADGSDRGMERGVEIRERMKSPILDTVTGLGLSAARRFQQSEGIGTSK